MINDQNNSRKQHQNSGLSEAQQFQHSQAISSLEAGYLLIGDLEPKSIGPIYFLFELSWRKPNSFRKCTQMNKFCTQWTPFVARAQQRNPKLMRFLPGFENKTFSATNMFLKVGCQVCNSHQKDCSWNITSAARAICPHKVGRAATKLPLETLTISRWAAAQYSSTCNNIIVVLRKINDRS